MLGHGGQRGIKKTFKTAMQISDSSDLHCRMSKFSLADPEIRQSGERRKVMPVNIVPQCPAYQEIAYGLTQRGRLVLAIMMNACTLHEGIPLIVGSSISLTTRV